MLPGDVWKYRKNTGICSENIVINVLFALYLQSLEMYALKLHLS